MYRVSIPPLLLQPLVENAIRHEIGNRIEGGTVKLTTFETEGEYWFVIEDSGVGIESEQLSRLPASGSDRRQGVGLLNINKRLRHEYGMDLRMYGYASRRTEIGGN